MAKETFPVMSAGAWWKLRAKFKQTIPSIVTDTYLASVLAMQQTSARNNILPSLKAVGIIDQDGKTGEIAKKWRDDIEYPKVCAEMRKSIYPQELLEAHPDPQTNGDGTSRWFSHKTGAGSNAVGKIVAFYTLLCEADASKGENEGQKSKPRVQNGNSENKKVKSPKAVEKRPPEQKVNNSYSMPAMNINIQIHISADATTNQIEQIFASMAKHLYKANVTNNES